VSTSPADGSGRYLVAEIVYVALKSDHRHRRRREQPRIGHHLVMHRPRRIVQIAVRKTRKAQSCFSNCHKYLLLSDFLKFVERLLA
jgi:hypothetical protein